MLTQLSIHNIVLVEKADIPFTAGLCVLTGETGAGKSILLDALGLALGQRADAKLVRAGQSQASVTACFEVAEGLAAQLEALGVTLENGCELIIRRTLSSDGKSKCFINDAPASVNTLKALGEALIEVHGQHDQRGLMEPRNHLALLDLYGGYAKQCAAVAAAYAVWRDLQQQLAALREQLEKAARDKEYLQHLVGELSKLGVSAGEADSLSQRRATMMQGEKLAGVLTQALSGLQGDASAGAGAMLRDVQKLLVRAAPKEGASFDAAIDALERAQNEVSQAEEALEQLQAACAYDASELERIEERLFAIRAAARKHNCEADALPDLCEKSAALLKAISDDQSQCAALEKAIATAKAAYVAAAQDVSQRREKAARALEKALLVELKPLKMDKTRFRVSQQPMQESDWSARGIDEVRFEAATNAGQEFAPLHRIASGGELSRFMLALKAVLSAMKSTPTLIFDEIDTGTGGAVADAIGARLALIARGAQVLVVTHLPQVAARGSHHLFIEKREVKGVTQTQITVLSAEQRTEEVARMLAGATVTPEARSAAKKLLEAAG